MPAAQSASSSSDLRQNEHRRPKTRETSCCSVIGLDEPIHCTLDSTTGVSCSWNGSRAGAWPCQRQDSGLQLGGKRTPNGFRELYVRTRRRSIDLGGTTSPLEPSSICTWTSGSAVPRWPGSTDTVPAECRVASSAARGEGLDDGDLLVLQQVRGQSFGKSRLPDNTICRGSDPWIAFCRPPVRLAMFARSETRSSFPMNVHIKSLPGRLSRDAHCQPKHLKTRFSGESLSSAGTTCDRRVIPGSDSACGAYAPAESLANGRTSKMDDICGSAPS